MDWVVGDAMFFLFCQSNLLRAGLFERVSIADLRGFFPRLCLLYSLVNMHVYIPGIRWLISYRHVYLFISTHLLYMKALFTLII